MQPAIAEPSPLVGNRLHTLAQHHIVGAKRPIAIVIRRQFNRRHARRSLIPNAVWRWATASRSAAGVTINGMTLRRRA